ncbi:MAG: YbjN domain-containing protein [Alphaproteobacteria bacterium]|nr:YbjN domain-containing protein [Alphaproteobacteria bacterium]
MTVAHQDRTSTAAHPLDMLERTVEDQGWPFERSGRDELNLSVAVRWCDHHFSWLWIGHFDLWPDDGQLLFRHAMIFPEARVSASQCEALLNLAVEACEHYYPAFQFVLWGGKTAEEAVAAAVLECAGQA